MDEIKRQVLDINPLFFPPLLTDCPECEKYGKAVDNCELCLGIGEIPTKIGYEIISLILWERKYDRRLVIKKLEIMNKPNESVVLTNECNK